MWGYSFPINGMSSHNPVLASRANGVGALTPAFRPNVLVNQGYLYLPFQAIFLFYINLFHLTIQLWYSRAMTKRRTRAPTAHENRAAHATTVAAPIAALRAARRASRAEISGSAQEVVTHLVQVGCSFTEAARQLEHMGFRTPRGNLRWTATQAEREFKRRALEELHAPRRGLKRNGYYFERTPRHRAGESRETQDTTGRSAWTKVEAARIAWWQQATHLPPNVPRPAEPLLDSRGRPLKGRRFSKIKKVVRPRNPA
jgi:hypothetical protein